MKILIFDVETNGLRPKKNTDWKLEPYIIQIACKLVQGKKVLGQLSSFIIPLDERGDRVSIPKEKFFLDQGYTDEFIREVGGDQRTVMAMFNQFMCRADAVVAHNANFDWPILAAAYKRNDRDIGSMYGGPVYCTMLSLVDHLKLPTKWGKYKWPTLAEAYEALVDPGGFNSAHDAMADVAETHKVLQAIEELKLELVEIKR